MSSSTVALVSVLASAAVGISVPLAAARFQRMQAASQRRASGLDELRSVLDLASVALARGEHATQNAGLLIDRESRDDSRKVETNAADTAIAEATLAVHSVAECRHRMAVRLGWAAPVCKHYGAALIDLRSETALLVSVREGGPSSDDLTAWAEVARAINEVRGQYADHRSAFYEAASAIVGSDRNA